LRCDDAVHSPAGRQRSQAATGGLHLFLISQGIFLLTTGTCSESIHIKIVDCEDHVIKIQ
jgi:hypothetical protein